MFVSNLTSDSDYFLVDRNFVTVSYTGDSIIYTFTVYGRLLQALIDGNDEIKVQLLKKAQGKIKYFTGTTKEKIEASNLGFVQNTKKELKSQLRRATLGEVTREIVNILPDDQVSGVGNGTINEANYFEFLPKIEQTTIINRTSRRRPIENPDIENFSRLTRKLFNDTGIYPGEVSKVAFPAQKISPNSDGLAGFINDASVKRMLENNLFKEYYENYYVKDTNTKIRQRFISAVAEYQKFTVKLEIPVDDGTPAPGPLQTLPTLNNLSLRISMLKKNIEMSSNMFKFKNTILFEEATAGARKVETQIVVPEPNEVLPDRVTVTNRENYRIRVSIYQYAPAGVTILKDKLRTTTLEPNEKITVDGKNIYFEKSDSRAYAVTASKYIPGVYGVETVVGMVKPPSSSTPPRNHPLFAADIVPEGDSSGAKIKISGLSDPDQSALVYKQIIGKTEKKLVGRVSHQSKAIIDRDIQLGDVILYTAEMQINGSSKNEIASAGFVSLLNGDVARINFSIADVVTSGPANRQRHSFKIVENITSTPASSLLASANKEGQAGVFEGEIDSTKQDTTMVTEYIVIRLKRMQNVIDVLGRFESGKKLRFQLDTRSDPPEEKYDYLVLPIATSLANLSYRTVVEGTDVATGNSYKYLHKKWRDKNFQRSEVLPSYSEVKKNNLGNIFSEIPPGVAETVTFTRKINAGRVISVNAVSKDTSDCAFLSWNYSGDLQTVLHFVILANYNGKKAPIGIAVPDNVRNKNDKISYCDEKLGSVSGEVIYSILPVLNTGEKGIESRGAKVSSTKNYPRKALRRK